MGIKEEKAVLLYTDGPFLFSQVEQLLWLTKKLIQNALLEALHATIVVLHILHKGLFLVMPNPPPFLFPSICHIA